MHIMLFLAFKGGLYTHWAVVFTHAAVHYVILSVQGAGIFLYRREDVKKSMIGPCCPQGATIR
jgi:hypothetical protein